MIFNEIKIHKHSARCFSHTSLVIILMCGTDISKCFTLRISCKAVQCKIGLYDQYLTNLQDLVSNTYLGKKQFNTFLTVVLYTLCLREANAKDWQGSDDTALIELRLDQ